MNIKASTAAILSIAVITLITGSVMAKEVPIKGSGKTDVKNRCTGVFWPTSVGGTYGCMNKDGSGIVCGGKDPKDKQTCSTFIKVPPRIPTRDEVRLGEKAESTPGVQ